MKTIVIAFTLLVIWNLAGGQKMVKVGAITFDADKAGIEFPTMIKSKETFEKTGIFETYIYSSRNKKYFFIINYKKDVNDGNFENYLATIDFTDGSNIFWTKESKYFTPTDCAIADDGSFLYVKWDEGFERDSSDKTNIFSVYNFEGKEIFTDRGVDKTIYNSEKNIVVYTKDPLKCQSEKEKIFFKDFKNNISWEKTINSRRQLILRNITPSGSYFIVRGDQLYFINREGNVIWIKNYENQPGRFILSDNGKYFVHMLNAKFSIYNINDPNNIIFSGDAKQFGNVKGFPIMVSFVENEDEIIAIAYAIGQSSFIIEFYTVNGVLLDQTPVNNQKADICFRVIKSGKMYNIFLDEIKVAEYENKW